ncbi:UNVERIFIED_CONTAM: hypothetical protein RMT77_006012 [Armadillidium vulgare]
MSQGGRKELLATIEQQREKITKYESKISDLVRAYKSLAKEKEALQASLAALSDSPGNLPQSSENKSQDEVTPTQNDKENDEDGCERQDSELTSLRNKISTLTLTIQTLTDEKNKLENSTINERKRILEEKKQAQEQHKLESEEWSKQKKEYESKIHELRSKIIVFQHEREKEASNGIMMLREVESRLSKERNEREKMEKLLEDTQEQNRQFALAIGTRSQEKKQQKQIIDLQNELEQVRCRLKKAEEQCNEPPMLKILQDQMEQMRNQYMEAILQEQRRAETAEKSVRSLSQAHEERVGALESNLADLSFTAASHDKNTRYYIDTIHSLKEKIAELSEENRSLNSKEEVAEISNKNGKEEEDAKSLVNNLISIWTQLLQLQKYSKNNFIIEELLNNSAVIHKVCFKRIKVLEDKIEYLNKEAAKDEKGNCQCGLKEQVDDLRERIRSMNSSNQMTETLHSHQVLSLKEELKKLRQNHEESLKNLEQECKVSVANLEQQLAEHCQRSLMTLQERDDEIHRLSKEIFKLNKEAEVQPSTVAAALLSQVNTGGSDGPLLHHFEDLARKELEVNKLRKEKNQLEKSMRDIQMNMIEKQQIMQDTIDDLMEEVERLKRNVSREGENLEYLKNVVLQYMTCVDGDSRLVILNAIAAVLKFTPEETKSVKNCLALWWWQAPDKRKKQMRNRFPSTSSNLGDYGGSVDYNLQSSFDVRGRLSSIND